MRDIVYIWEGRERERERERGGHKRGRGRVCWRDGVLACRSYITFGIYRNRLR